MTHHNAERLGMDWVFGVEFIDAQTPCEEGNAILSRRALGGAAHAFHDVGGKTRGALRAPYDWATDPGEPRAGPRSFVAADVAFGSGVLRLVSGHLENKSSPEERAGEADEMIAHVAAKGRRRAVVAGDFNVFPDVGDSRLDAPLFGAFARACFYNPHGDMPQVERRTRPTLAYPIDFTYVRGARRVARGVLNTIDKIPSDHYPVWVDVEP